MRIFEMSVRLGMSLYRSQFSVTSAVRVVLGFIPRHSQHTVHWPANRVITTRTGRDGKYFRLWSRRDADSGRKRTSASQNIRTWSTLSIIVTITDVATRKFAVAIAVFGEDSLGFASFD